MTFLSLTVIATTTAQPPPLAVVCHGTFNQTGTKVYGNMSFAFGNIFDSGGRVVSVVCPPIGNIDWAQRGDIFGQNYTLNNVFYPTRTFTRWPLVHPPKRCVTVLETNVLAPADCPGYQSCGDMTWTQVDRSWYGKEVGLCVGPGAQHTSVTTSGVYYHGGVRATDWGMIYLARPMSSDYDVQQAHRDLMLIRFKHRDVMIMSAVYHNFISINSSGPTLTNVGHQTTSGGDICPTMLPAARSGEGLIYDGPTLNEWPTGVPINVPLRQEYFEPRRGVGNTRVRINNTHIALLTTSDLLWEIWVGDEQVICMPHGYVTAYAFPGHTWLRSALTSIANILLDVIISLVTTLTSAVVDVLSVANDTYRFYEMSVVFALIIWRYDSPWRAALAVVAYGMVVGFTR